MMKKKAAALAALALAGVMILTACSSSEQESDQQSAAKNDTIKSGTEVQTEEPLQAVSGTQSVSGTAVSVAGESGSTSDATAAAPVMNSMFKKNIYCPLWYLIFIRKKLLRK